MRSGVVGACTINRKIAVWNVIMSIVSMDVGDINVGIVELDYVRMVCEKINAEPAVLDDVSTLN
jgi:hypothetical protein